MKKLISLVLVAVMVLGCISLAACGGGGGTATTTTPGGGEQGNGGDEQGNGGNGGDEQGNGGDEGASDNLEDILGLGADVESVKYDMVMTAPGMPQTTSHIWVKQNKMRIEMTVEGVHTIMISDAEEGVVYTYMPDENIAYKVTYDPTTATESATEQAQAITDYDYEILGTETFDGKECLVIQYTYEGTTTKMWLWKEHGFPLKIVVTTAEGTSTIENRNVDFGDIDDSMFELPAGVEIWEF